MRVKIDKGWRGRRSQTTRDIALRVNKNGARPHGKQRYKVLVRFMGDIYKKITDTEYISVELDEEEGRLYLLAGTRADGFRLSGDKNKIITFALTEDYLRFWVKRTGDYDLLQDANCGDYYIEFSKVVND